MYCQTEKCRVYVVMWRYVEMVEGGMEDIIIILFTFVCLAFSSVETPHPVTKSFLHISLSF